MTLEELIVDAITIGSITHIPMEEVGPSRIFNRLLIYSKQNFDPIRMMHNVIILKKYCNRSLLEFDFEQFNEGLIDKFKKDKKLISRSFIRVTLAFINKRPLRDVESIIHYSVDFSKKRDSLFYDFYDAVLEGVYNKRVEDWYDFSFTFSQRRSQIYTDTCTPSVKTIELIIIRLEKLAITHPVYVLFVCRSFGVMELEPVFKIALKNYQKRSPSTSEVFDQIKGLYLIK